MKIQLKFNEELSVGSETELTTLSLGFSYHKHLFWFLKGNKTSTKSICWGSTVWIGMLKEQMNTLFPWRLSDLIWEIRHGNLRKRQRVASAHSGQEQFTYLGAGGTHVPNASVSSHFFIASKRKLGAQFFSGRLSGTLPVQGIHKEVMDSRGWGRNAKEFATRRNPWENVQTLRKRGEQVVECGRW